MGPEKMKLSDMEKRIYDLEKRLERINTGIHPKHQLRLDKMQAWVMDPPPFMGRLSDEKFNEVCRIRLEGLAEISELDSKASKIEADIFRKIGASFKP